MNDETPTASMSPARQRVIEGASSLFVELGYADVSMQQIADQIGITKATLYHHFRDKEDLFVECMRHRFSASRDEMQRALADTTSFREFLTLFALEFQCHERTDMGRLMSDFKRHVAPERHREFWASQRRPWEYLEESVAAGMESGEIRAGDPNLTARMCFGAILGPLQARGDQQPGTREDALAIVSMLLDGLAAR